MPPNNLNLFVQPDELSNILGVDIYSENYPAYVECPMGPHNLIIYKHPAEGYWFFCPECNFAGDAIELVQAAKRLSTQEAVRLLTSKSAFSLPTIEVEHRYQSYIDYYINSRHIVNSLWEKSRTDLIEKLKPQWREILLHRDWRIDDEHVWKKTLGKYIGAAHRSDIENTLYGRTGRIFRADRWSNVLVMPWQEMPGKICGFTFISKENTIRWDLESIRTGRRPEGGLFMMGDVTPGVDTIYAFKDYNEAINLQLRIIPDTFNLLNMVVWDHNTEVSWQSLKAEKIVFWTPELDADIFQQASKVDNAFVYATDKKETKNLINNFTTAEILKSIKKKSAPAPEAFADWVATLDSKKSYKALRKYGLADFYMPSLADPRSNMGSGVASFDSDNQIVLNGTLIIEKDGKWYAVGKYGEKEMICDAPIHLDYITIYDDQSSAKFSGTILFNGEKIPFITEANEEISDPNKTSKWLQFFVSIVGGRGFPDIHPKWTRFLFTIAQRMSSPQTIKGSAKVGWDYLTKSFVFPHFKLEQGVKNPSSFDMEAAGPLKDLTDMTKLDFTKMIKNGDFVNYAALAIPFLYNCTSTMLRRSPIKTAINCRSNGNSMMKALTEGIGRAPYIIDRRKAVTRKIEAESSLHDIPMLMSLSPTGYRLFLKWSDETTACNCLGVFDEKVIRAASINTNWFIPTIDCYDPGWVVEMLVESIPWYIANAQLDNEARPNPMEMAIFNFFKYVQQSVQLDASTISAIKRRFSYGTLEGEIPPEERFVHFVIHLLRSKLITMKHKGASREYTTITLYDDHNTARISKASLRKFLKETGLHDIQIPCVDNIIDEGDAVKMELSYWDTLSKKYMKREMSQKKC